MQLPEIGSVIKIISRSETASTQGAEGKTFIVIRHGTSIPGFHAVCTEGFNTQTLINNTCGGEKLGKEYVDYRTGYFRLSCVKYIEVNSKALELFLKED